MQQADKKQVRIILNPISGTRRKVNLSALASRIADPGKFHIEIHQTRSARHAFDLSEEAAEKGVDLIVAAGGDGTLNQVAAGLTGTGKPLGIVPLGSGNGFARALGIPLDAEKALSVAFTGRPRLVDTGKANQHTFLNVCGFGFDAHVSAQFAQAGTRGFSTYARISMRELSKFQPESYKVKYNGTDTEYSAFVMSVCNGPQYGSNAWIAPMADFSDGTFDVTILQKTGWLNMGRMAFHLFRKELHHAPGYQGFRTSELTVIMPEAGFVNIDGEAIRFEPVVEIKNLPNSLQVIIPQ